MKTLEVFQRSENQWILLNSYVDHELIRAAPFDAVAIDLGSLWLD